MSEEEIFMMPQESGFFTALWRSYYYSLNFLGVYGWPLVGSVIFGLMLWNWLQPKVQAWLRAWEDAAHHKDPDAVLGRERALRAAREARQRQLLEASRRAAELQAERREQKRREAAALLAAHGVAGGRRLGSDADFLPLSGGASCSTYRAPRRSPCAGGGGGCGR